MTKVLIADDEQPVLDGLTFLIQKHFDDLEVCAAAKNGREALTLVRLHQPEIVLIDVKMPGISGLDVIRELRQSFPNLVFILVTAYERFEIAKEAIDLGIQDYLLKPLSRDALIQVLQRARQTVRERRGSYQRELSYRDWKQEARVYLEHSLLFWADLHSPLDADTSNLLSLLELSDSTGYVVSMEWNSVEPGMSHHFFTRFKEQLQFKDRCYFGVWKEGRFSFFIPSATFSSQDSSAWTKEIPAEIQWRCGVGSVQKVEWISRSKEESLWALEESKKGEVVSWSPKAPNSDTSFPFGLEKALLRALSAGDPDQVSSLCGLVWSAFESSSREPEVLRSFAQQLVTVAAHHQGMEEGLEVPVETLWEKLDCDFSNLKDALREVLTRLAWRRPRDQSISPLVEKAIDFVKENYSRIISLEEVAKIVGVHPQYLSRIFSQEKGESFVDFMTRLRVSKSKELLKEGLSVKETSAAVGYTDANYFSRLFKKWEGLTPGEYAQGKRG